jgi:hypothetical protein
VYDRISWQFVRWIGSFRRRQRPLILELLSGYDGTALNRSAVPLGSPGSRTTQSKRPTTCARNSTVTSIGERLAYFG